MTSRAITSKKIWIREIIIALQCNIFWIKHKSSSGEHASQCWNCDCRLHIYMQYDIMILIYGGCERNARGATRVYSEWFPRDRHPMHETITDTLHHLRELGFVAPWWRISRWATCNVWVTPEEMLAFILLNSQLGMAEISKACGCMNQHVWH